MTVPETFQHALDGGGSLAELAQEAAEIEERAGAVAAVACLEAWLAKVRKKNAAAPDVAVVAEKLAAALERDADQRPAGREASLRSAFDLYCTILDDMAGKERIAADLMALNAADAPVPSDVLDSFDDVARALSVLKKRARAPHIKIDPKRALSYRWARLRIAEAVGDDERAFFEALGAVQKSPQTQALVDELFRLALLTERADEAARVLQDTAENFTHLTGEARGRVFNKLAALNERALDDKAAALSAYRSSLEWWPEGKAARRHATRLATELGEPAPELPPPASSTVVAPQPAAPPAAPLTETEAAADPGPTASFAYSRDNDDDDGSFEGDDEPTAVDAGGSRPDASHPATLSAEASDMSALSDAATVRPRRIGSDGAALLVDSQTNVPLEDSADHIRTETFVGAPSAESDDEGGARDDTAGLSVASPRPVSLAGPAADAPPHPEFSDDDDDAETVQAANGGSSETQMTLSADSAEFSDPSLSEGGFSEGGFSDPALTAEGVTEIHAPIGDSSASGVEGLTDPVVASSSAAPIPGLDERHAPFADSDEDVSTVNFPPPRLMSLDADGEPEPTLPAMSQIFGAAVPSLVSDDEGATQQNPASGAAYASTHLEPDDAGGALDSADPTPVAPWDEPVVSHQLHMSKDVESSAQSSLSSTSDEGAATDAALAAGGLPDRSGPQPEATTVDRRASSASTHQAEGPSDGDEGPSDAPAPSSRAALTVDGTAIGPAPAGLDLTAEAPGPGASSADASSADASSADASSADASSSDASSSEASSSPDASSSDAASSEALSLASLSEPSGEGVFASADEMAALPDEFSTSSPEAPGAAGANLSAGVTVVDKAPSTRAMSRVPTDPFGTQVSALRVFAEGQAAEGPEAELRALGEQLVHAAEQGQIDDEVQQQVAEAALSFPDVGLQIAHRLRAQAPREVALTVPDFWLQVARVQDDVEDVFDLLVELAPYDDILAHYLDERLSGAGRGALRLKLLEAQVAAATDDARTVDLLRRQLALVQVDTERFSIAERLVLKFHVDEEDAVREVVRALDEAPAKRRAKIYGRVVRSLPKTERAAVYEALLQDRIQLGDHLGSEQAAESLLRLDERHIGALDALIEQWAGVKQRAPARRDLLERRIKAAVKERDEAVRRPLVMKLVAHLEAFAPGRVAATLSAELEAHPDHQSAEATLFQHLTNKGDDEALIDALERAARHGAVAERAEKLLRAVGKCRTLKPPNLVRAATLLDRALELTPNDTEALLLRADLARDGGDTTLAVQSLERLAAGTEEGPKRAKVHFRLARLLETELQRPEDALKRYIAATMNDSTMTEAWICVRDVASRVGDRAAEGRALEGLAKGAAPGHDEAQHYRAWGHFLRDVSDRPEAAERALRRVVVNASRTEADMEDWLACLIAPEAPDAAHYESTTLRSAAPIVEEVFAARPLGWTVSVLRLGALCRAPKADKAASERLLAALDAFPHDLALLRAALLQPQGNFSLEHRRDVMLRLLLRHDDAMTAAEKVELYAELALMRADDGDQSGALQAMGQAVTAAQDDADLLARLNDEALELGLAHHPADTDKAGVRVRIALLRARAKKRKKSGGARDLSTAARLFAGPLDDTAAARALLEEAVQLDEDAVEPREALLELDVKDGQAERVITSLEGLLSRVNDPVERAALLVEKGTVLKTMGDGAGASRALIAAIELDPTNARALDEAERTFTENADAPGLEKLYLTQLKLLDKDAVQGRVSLLGRLSQVRRYDLDDDKGAIEALEAIAALDLQAVKPREDAARLYAARGEYDVSMERWRQVLQLDPSRDDAWRGLWAAACAHGDGDAMYVVAEALLLTDVAGADVAAGLRQVRPPFPAWPTVPKDTEALRRHCEHPLERSVLRTTLSLVGPHIRPLFTEPLKTFGIPKQSLIEPQRLPRSVQQALKVGAELMNLKTLPPVYAAELGGAGGDAPEIALLPAETPALVLSERVVKGGMTVGRAFALGRALAWFSPHGMLAATLKPAEIKGVLEALVTLFVPDHVDAQARTPEIGALAQRIDKALNQNVSRSERSDVRRGIEGVTRQYVHARDTLRVADWVAGVGYSADRIGFLLSGSLPAAMEKLSASGGPGPGARSAIKELILYTIGQDYLSSRRLLNLALDADATRRFKRALHLEPQGDTL